MSREPGVAFVDAVERVRARTAELRDADWNEGRRQSAGRTLEALAVAMAAAPGANGSISKAECELRIMAERLQAKEASAFETSGWIKQGLQAALSAIDARIRSANVQADLTGWMESARRAVASIDESTFMTFQRAPIQDAFRTIADLLRVWEQRA